MGTISESVQICSTVEENKHEGRRTNGYVWPALRLCIFAYLHVVNKKHIPGLSYPFVCLRTRSLQPPDRSQLNFERTFPKTCIFIVYENNLFSLPGYKYHWFHRHDKNSISAYLSYRFCLPSSFVRARSQKRTMCVGIYAFTYVQRCAETKAGYKACGASKRLHLLDKQRETQSTGELTGPQKKLTKEEQRGRIQGWAH